MSRITSKTKIGLPALLTKMPQRILRPVTGVATDIDHTLTTKEGWLDPNALLQLHRLMKAGVAVVPVTGRSFTYGEHLMRVLPVPCLVSENGFAYHARQHAGGPIEPFVVLKSGNEGTPVSLESVAAEISEARAAMLKFFYDKVQKEISAGVQRLKLTDDYPGRVLELTLNLNENGADISPSEVARLGQIFSDAGYLHTYSSIHFHAWPRQFDHNKFLGFQVAMKDHLKLNFDSARKSWVFVGDSFNDIDMFRAFSHAVGVRNIERFLPFLKQAAPSYWTKNSYGRGFAELARFLFQTERVSHRKKS